MGAKPRFSRLRLMLSSNEASTLGYFWPQYAPVVMHKAYIQGTANRMRTCSAGHQVDRRLTSSQRHLANGVGVHLAAETGGCANQHRCETHSSQTSDKMRETQELSKEDNAHNNKGRTTQGKSRGSAISAATAATATHGRNIPVDHEGSLKLLLLFNRNSTMI